VAGITAIEHLPVGARKLFTAFFVNRFVQPLRAKSSRLDRGLAGPCAPG
jgi:hypothetical protein